MATKKGKKKRLNASAAAVLCRQNAEKTAQPGIIASIMDELVLAKKKNSPVTTTEILAKLKKQYPDREEVGMLVTVRAQLSRLPNEKGFAIDKTRDGRNVRYQAA